MYIDIAYCDDVLTSTAWIAADDVAKQRAIDTGEIWIKSGYICSVTDEVKYANALLADMYINNTLFTPQDQTIESDKVKAGSVETETSYFKQDISDPSFSEINLLLSNSCDINSNASFKVMRV